MPGLRFYACSRCETVYAEPTPQTTCPRCDTGELQEITGHLQTDSYFLTRHREDPD